MFASTKYIVKFVIIKFAINFFSLLKKFYLTNHFFFAKKDSRIKCKPFFLRVNVGEHIIILGLLAAATSSKCPLNVAKVAKFLFRHLEKKFNANFGKLRD
jgi:hypothetical protein